MAKSLNENDLKMASGGSIKVVKLTDVKNKAAAEALKNAGLGEGKGKATVALEVHDNNGNVMGYAPGTVTGMEYAKKVGGNEMYGEKWKYDANGNMAIDA